MNQEYNTQVGKRLFNERTKLGMSRAELGRLVDLHETTVKRYEDGDIKALSIEKIEHFASALKTSAAYLMGWEESPEQGIYSNSVHTIAAHHDNEEWTEEELLEIEKFKEFVKMKRNK